jgi:putative spermidine/putrescine transport system permease protein
MWSFVDPDVGWDYTSLFPKTFSLYHWQNIINNTGIGKAIANSYIIAILTTIFSFLLSVPTAYAIGRKNIKFKGFFKIVMLLPLMLPGMVVALFLGRMLLNMGLTQTMTGVIIGHIFLCIPYMIRIMTVSFEAVPQDLVDAAENLGAGRFAKFMEIYFPLITPGIFAGAIFTMIYSLEEFTIAFIIGIPKIQTITTILFSYLGYNLIKTSSSVVSLILVIPNVILLIIVERFIKTEYMGAALGKL